MPLTPRSLPEQNSGQSHCDWSDLRLTSNGSAKMLKSHLPDKCLEGRLKHTRDRLEDLRSFGKLIDTHTGEVFLS